MDGPIINASLLSQYNSDTLLPSAIEGSDLTLLQQSLQSWINQGGFNEQLARQSVAEQIVSAFLNDDSTVCLKLHNISSLPDLIGSFFTGLQQLEIRADHCLQSLPNSIGELQCLNSLVLEAPAIEHLPDNLVYLSNLQWLQIENTAIEKLPDNFGLLDTLEVLSVSNTNLHELPPTLGQATQLKTLYLAENNLHTIPDSIQLLDQLAELTLWETQRKETPPFVYQLSANVKLAEVQQPSAEFLVGINEWVEQGDSSEDRQQVADLIINAFKFADTKLQLYGLNVKTLPEHLGELKHLKTLHLDYISNLQNLPKSLNKLINLENLRIYQTDIQGLDTILSSFKKLDSLQVDSTLQSELKDKISIPVSWLEPPSYEADVLLDSSEQDAEDILTDNELEAIRQYTDQNGIEGEEDDSIFYQLNYALRNNLELTEDLAPIYDSLVSAIKKLQVLSINRRESITYRGINDARLINFVNLLEGSTLQDSSFLSTTENPESVEKFILDKDIEQLLSHEKIELFLEQHNIKELVSHPILSELRKDPELKLLLQQPRVVKFLSDPRDQGFTAHAVKLQLFGHSGVSLWGLSEFDLESEVLYPPNINFDILLKHKAESALGRPNYLVLAEQGLPPTSGTQGYIKSLTDPEVKQKQTSPHSAYDLADDHHLKDTQLHMDNMEWIGDAESGSNFGGFYRDRTTGIEWYLKYPDDTDAALNEVLAAKLYQLAGINVPQVEVLNNDGELWIASRVVNGITEDPAALITGSVKGIGEGFVIDAWLANWDVVGEEYDNLVVKNGAAVRIDTGGALRYRAQGDLKGEAFGATVTELDTLRDDSINPEAASVFAHLNQTDFKRSANHLRLIQDDELVALVNRYGPEENEQRDELLTLLLARKQDLLGKIEREEFVIDVKNAAVMHPQKNDSGQAIVIQNPNTATPGEAWCNQNQQATIVPGVEGVLPDQLNGTAFKPWDAAPTNLDGWKQIPGTIEIDEPEFQSAQDKQPASGVIIVEPDGRIWVMHPTNQFGDYNATFPKGRCEDKLSLQQSAIKEAYEETGLQVKITGYLTDVERTTTKARYYIAERVGGNPADMGWESQAVSLVPKDQLQHVLTHEADQPLLDAVLNKLII